TDIEGSTAAWEADAEAMAAALARHDELVEQVVTSRGGRLIKTRGEDDARGYPHARASKLNGEGSTSSRSTAA
ncbi:hypothetical protein, partial [Mycobacterium sp.]|uniref:hypothetical protein n=1 Tax=Mycobacterium sp. TaxID=1785 RepID=UPI0025E46384